MKYLLALILASLLLVSCTYDVIDNTHYIDDNLNVTGNLTVEDQSFLGLHYAEGYYQSYSNPITINISSSNVYYNVTGYNISSSRGLTVNGGVIINHSANYKVNAVMSFSGGNAGVYELELHINNIAQPHCSFFRTTTSAAIGSASFSCIEYLNKGDVLYMKIKDINPPPQNVQIYYLNFNIVEIP